MAQTGQTCLASWLNQAPRLVIRVLRWAEEVSSILISQAVKDWEGPKEIESYQSRTMQSSPGHTEMHPDRH